ncbi:MAG: imidazole glycerol phosphate synthase subunit HisH [Candidatus Lokiarchaeota archaeon]|nr:imidazole glycerol phosphate synthase subunit HisH [Candidatus Lokiarchaeota archaeon]
MPLDIAIIDYNAGNLGSIYKAVKFLDAKPKITNKVGEILSADGIILPGVGAFGDCMDNFRKAGFIEKNLFEKILEQERPFLGICLGLQMLFEESEEMGIYKGLGLIKGKVIRFPQGVKCPQIGWNTIAKKQEHFIFKGIPDDTYFYFVHSYHAVCSKLENILAETTYAGTMFPSMVIKKNIIASQFHPEKSGKWGLKILKNFLESTN